MSVICGGRDVSACPLHKGGSKEPLHKRVRGLNKIVQGLLYSLHGVEKIVNSYASSTLGWKGEKCVSGVVGGGKKRGQIVSAWGENIQTIKG